MAFFATIKHHLSCRDPILGFYLCFLCYFRRSKRQLISGNQSTTTYQTKSYAKEIVVNQHATFLPKDSCSPHFLPNVKRWSNGDATFTGVYHTTFSSIGCATMIAQFAFRRFRPFSLHSVSLPLFQLHFFSNQDKPIHVTQPTWAFRMQCSTMHRSVTQLALISCESQFLPLLLSLSVSYGTLHSGTRSLVLIMLTWTRRAASAYY